MWMWRHDRSWAENFLSTWTPLLLAAMAVTSLLLRYVRDPISCHYVYPQANDYFTDDCFRQTSVLMRSEEFVQYAAQVWQSQRGILRPRGSEAEKPFRTWPKQRTWHQWVPLALGLFALLSLLPHLLGRLLGGLLWLDGDALLRTLALGPGHVTLVKDSALAVRAGLARGGNWGLSAAALARKGVACATCVLQLALIVGWFRPPLVAAATGGGGEEGRRNLTGVNVTVPEVLEDVPLPVTPFFCTVEFTHNARAQSLTMQCLLPLNQVFTKAFIFLFYFFLVLLILCLLDAFYWLGRLFLPHLRDVALLRNLSVIGQSEAGSPRKAQEYIFKGSLGPDGRLLLALIGDHCGPAVTLRFVGQLWQAFHGAGAPSSPSGSAHPSLGSAHPSLSSAHLSLGPAPDVADSGGLAGGEGGQAGEEGHDDGDIALQEMGDVPPPGDSDHDTAKLCQA